MKHLSLILLFLFSAFCYGQKEVTFIKLSEKDSIVYKNLKHQFAKCINPAPDSSYAYASIIEQFSLDRNYAIGIVEAPYFKAYYFRRIQMLDSAVFYFDSSIKLAKKYHYQCDIKLSQNVLYRIYYFLGQTGIAIEVCSECLEVSKEIKDLPIITDFYAVLKTIYSLEKIQAIINKKLTDPSFNITEFSDALGMSLMQLHKKLKGLIGITASELIRSQRLILATQFLNMTDVNMSEVGYPVGFNDYSYFAKCFKEVYYCSSSNYANKNTQTIDHYLLI
ncbi:helix-turn-helix transcriptional regulator [Winogradskyella schleiferi]|uniref:helix-turn-helix transcriptional regulator n=1 Tax=Winogradskyella schleiferi TaxID=2686078 RepID=UPI0015BFBE3D|nr:helix-turn-helix transcriptional regulator [Winogradskyella schleiferi]